MATSAVGPSTSAKTRTALPAVAATTAARTKDVPVKIGNFLVGILSCSVNLNDNAPWNPTFKVVLPDREDAFLTKIVPKGTYCCLLCENFLPTPATCFESRQDFFTFSAKSILKEKFCWGKDLTMSKDENDHLRGTLLVLYFIRYLPCKEKSSLNFVLFTLFNIMPTNLTIILHSVSCLVWISAATMNITCKRFFVFIHDLWTL